MAKTKHNQRWIAVVILTILTNVASAGATTTPKVYIPVVARSVGAPTPDPTPTPTPTPQEPTPTLTPTPPPTPAPTAAPPIIARLGAQIERPISTTNSFVPGSVIKATIQWSRVERERGDYDWYAEFDEIIRQSAGHDLIVGVRGTPYWARSDPNRECKPPQEQFYPDLANFVVQVLNRYDSIIAVEVWNEAEIPNNNTKFDAFVGCWWSPTQYARLLDVLYPIVKAAHPGVEVWAGASGHITDWVDGFTNYTDKFDKFSIHAYGHWSNGIYTSLVDEKVASARIWSKGKPVVITETGLLCNDYADRRLVCDWRFEEDQKVFFHWMMNTYGPSIEYIIWYPQAREVNEDWRHSSLAYNGRLKPVWFEFRDFILGEGG